MFPLAHGTAATTATVEPLALATLVLGAILYARGARTLRRQTAGRRILPPWRLASAGAGILALSAALASPLHGLSEQYFSLHMVQHVVVLLAAPLLALGGIGYASQAGLPRGVRTLTRRVRRTTAWRSWRHAAPAALGAATVGHIATLWLWHAPPLYDAAVRHSWLHGLEHASLAVGAVAMWVLLLRPTPAARLSGGLGVLCLAAVLFQGGILGALLAFARVPLYLHTGGFGTLSAIQDQQLAGALMWVLPGFVYAVAAAVIFTRWLRAVEDHRLRAEQPA